MIVLPLRHGYKVLLDEHNRELTRYPWYVDTKARGANYAVCNLPKKNLKQERAYLHRMVAKPPDKLVTVHINGNTLDNREQNLVNLTKKEAWAFRNRVEKVFVAETIPAAPPPQAYHSRHLPGLYDFERMSRDDLVDWLGYLTNGIYALEYDAYPSDEMRRVLAIVKSLL